MTPERIRIKVAEAMGWKHPEYGYMQNAWRESNGSWHFGSNVLDDLNACAEAERNLTENQRAEFADALCRICAAENDGPGTAVSKAFHATASQRATALAAVITAQKNTP